MSDWYYADTKNVRQGPVSAAQLAALHGSGQLRPETLVWRTGLDSWKPWREMMREVDLGAASPPPPPPPRPQAAGGAQNPVAAGASPYATPRSAVHDDRSVITGGHVVYAGFWKRVAASIIDGFVTMALSYAILIPMVMLTGGGWGMFIGEPDSGGAGILMFFWYLISLMVPLLYMSFMHSSANQATLGKMAVGIKVSRLDGERISFWRAFGRYFGYILSTMILFIGVIMVAFTERKQALHDMISDTLVVDKHAFTAQPELQREELGAVTITVLVLAGLLFIGLFALIAIGIAALASGGWH